MGKLKNLRIRITVDRDNHVGPFDADPVLNRAGNSRRDIKLGPDGLPRLSNLPVGAYPAFLNELPRAAIFRPQNFGQCPDVLKIFRRFEAKPARHHNIRIGKLGLVRVPVCNKPQHLGHDFIFGKAERMVDNPSAASPPAARAWAEREGAPWPSGDGNSGS